MTLSPKMMKRAFEVLASRSNMETLSAQLAYLRSPKRRHHYANVQEARRVENDLRIARASLQGGLRRLAEVTDLSADEIDRLMDES